MLQTHFQLKTVAVSAALPLETTYPASHFNSGIHSAPAYQISAKSGKV